MPGILLGIVVFLACYVLGARALRLLKIPMESDEELVIGTGLGLAFLGNFVLLMGLSHLLNPTAFCILFSIFLLLIWLERKTMAQSFTKLKKIFFVPVSPLTLFFGIVASVAILSCLMEVLSPEIANDSLCYHLHLPKLFLREGRFFLAPYELNTMYPMFMEMLYTFGLGLSGVTLAKFLHFGTGILSALAVFTWVRQFSDKKVPWGSAVFFLTTPSVINEMGVTYVDVGLAYFALLFLFSIWKWKSTQSSSWLAISGVFAGTCIGIKYLGIIILIPALLIVIFDRSLVRPKLKGLFALCLAIILSCGFWYIRNLIVLGNPVFPFLSRVFGAGDPVIYNDYVGLGVNHTFLNFLKLPWTVVMRPELFGGFGGQIGPGYLAFLPLLLWTVQTPFLSGMIFFVFVYFLSWFLAGQMLRFFIPALPILVVLLASGWTRAGFGPIAKRFLVFLFCALLSAQMVLAVYHFRRNFAVALGLETQENFLLRNERSYRVAKYVNESIPQNAKVYVADETHLYYFSRVLARNVYFARTHLFDRSLPPEKIIRWLQQEGFTHILFATSTAQAPAPLSRDLSISGMIERGELAAFLAPVFRDHYGPPHGEPGYSYVLFRISPR